MEIVFPVSMLAVGLTIGAASIWFITRTKLKYEFERGRAHGETERAVLLTRLEEERKANQEKLTTLKSSWRMRSKHSQPTRCETTISRSSISRNRTSNRFSRQRKANSSDVKMRSMI
jgi:hypothetical protein